MKILHITVRADLGGGPRHIEYLLNQLNKNNDIENFVACPDDKPFSEIFTILLGFDKILEIPHRKISFLSINLMRRFIDKNGIEYLHCHGKGASVYGKLMKFFYKKRLKVIYTTHGLHFDNYNFLLNKANLFYEKLTSKYIDQLIYVSESESLVAKNNKVFQKNKNTVVLNGVPIPKIVIPTLDEKNLFLDKIYPDRISNNIIVTVSRFDVQKNMWECLEFSKEFPNYNFLWIGNGIDKIPIQEKANSLGLKNLFFWGTTNNVIDILKYCDLYLSTSKWEGMPLALLEAMSLGIPIVASNVDGNKDLINETTGATYELGNIKDGKRKIEKLLEYSKLNSSFIKLFFIKYYSSENMANKILNIYKNV